MTDAKLEVLMVEDEDAHAELIARACGDRSGLNLTVVRNLREARARLGVSVPDLLLLDSLLPDGDGLELIEDVDPPYPVIVMTSQGDDALAARARAAGACRYVVKSPATLIGMPDLVAETLEQWRRRIGDSRYP